MTHVVHLFDESAGWEQRVAVTQLLDRLSRDDFNQTLATLHATGRAALRSLDVAIHAFPLLAGVDALYLHTFRHTAAHHWLLDGGTEIDLQTRAGWSSPQMLRRYASTTRSERSHAAPERFGLGDKL